ncbi:hypothetical protein B0H14DRAFT_2904220 [Mycena olivaceomarginata]|nr:hypothetical protein B0H14DRAFT_2904220 [Mycena olivaceomarginata]
MLDLTPEAPRASLKYTGGSGGEGGEGMIGGNGGLGQGGYIPQECRLERMLNDLDVKGGTGGKGGKGQAQGGDGGEGQSPILDVLLVPREYGELKDPGLSLDKTLITINRDLRNILIAEGYDTVGALREATVFGLRSVNGVMDGHIAAIKNVVKEELRRRGQRSYSWCRFWK